MEPPELKIYHTPEFQKLWKKVPKDIQSKAIKREKIFRQDPFHPSLKTHKLKGLLEGLYAFSVDYRWRIIFHFQNGGVFFDVIGTHSVYR